MSRAEQETRHERERMVDSKTCVCMQVHTASAMMSVRDTAS
jgi:hypothetical protein